MNKGLNLPNRQWDAYTEQEMAALFDLAPQTILVIAYGTIVDYHHYQQLRPYLEAYPQTVIFVRCYATGILLRDPAAWAVTCGAMVSVFGPKAECIPGNEFNVPAESNAQLAADWPAQVKWLETFIHAYAGAQIDHMIHLPALSPGEPNYQEGWAAYQAADLFDQYDVTDAHVYALDQPLPEASGLGITTITEFNQVLPADFFDDYDGLANDACYFLLGGTADQSAYNILNLPAYYASFKEWTMPEPQPIYDVGSGVATKIASEGDVPTSSEEYIGDKQFSLTTGKKGLYVYSFGENTTHFLAWTE